MAFHRLAEDLKVAAGLAALRLDGGELPHKSEGDLVWGAVVVGYLPPDFAVEGLAVLDLDDRLALRIVFGYQSADAKTRAA